MSTTVLQEGTTYFAPTSFLIEQTASGTRVPLAHAHSQYNSKLYTPVISINPLIAAASPILSLIGRLRNAFISQDTAELYLDLIHEIKSFESYAQRLNYRAEIILIARYALSAMVDETLLHSTSGKEKEWEKHKLLLFFQQEDWGGDRFFIILERLEQDPLFYIDLLELTYLCLSLGYEGKFRYQERGHVELQKIINNLFDKIKKIRHELKPDFNSKKITLKQKPKVKEILIPIRLFIMSTCLSLILIGSSLSIEHWQHLNPLNIAKNLVVNL
ncbi:MAG: IcmH [uncultured bacterium]|nr:MAG: IcmH [uncultured bacterium]OGT15235.1 MAG: hypothetical protein A3B69_05490 [Gammaproteobacteria bacterium RIFCSPHIGHO2_02_FULL_38_33]OGT24789.1 MAG: hypothetical protein A2W47_02510 [Gammaproteobacteria bacterium RIFCSPHIGHO2_12_38_15]OGT69081.1 MAG: hypothetical protein A3I12_05890 [Gammaproteobacteria bacterium RIFCSPLOWO2_02_FULL_38_11]OGT77655.1 MAG: hypothetical protein A3G71_02050 [Gammaproteobacteria bacterium RIFCSPLOWO2_12_FULL_38_14]